MSRSDGSSLRKSNSPVQNGNGSSFLNGNGAHGNGANGNGNGANGNGANGNGANGNGGPVPAAPEPQAAPLPPEPRFDKPVILRQSPVWAAAIIGLILGVTTFSVGWAAWAKVDEAIPAQGKLEPQGAVKEIQAPVGGVVEDILIEDGQRVRKGDDLILFDQTAAQAELESLEKVRSALVSETQFYEAQLSGSTSAIALPPEKIPPALAKLTENRAALVAENELFRAQLNGTSPATLDNSQQVRLQTNLAEQNSREMAAQLAISQLTQQLNQAQVRLANTQQKLINAQSQLVSAQGQLENSRDRLSIDAKILKDIQPLAEEGGIANIQFLRQKQEVSKGEADVDQQIAEVNNRQAEVTNQQAELMQLQQETQRLQLAIAQSQEELSNTVARSQQDPQTRIADNDKRVSEIDSQLTKLIVENKKRVSELDGQISKAKVTLSYQKLEAPVDGTVFDLKPTGIGYVVNSNEPILKVVPSEGLVAKVFITNRDIGFVQEGMEVDVRIDSFPYSEFGDIKGELISIGDDALPPDQIYPFYRFPAKVRLDRQSIRVNGKEIELQSGMSLSVNIKTRPRRVITYFTDLFTRKIDSFKSRQ